MFKKNLLFLLLLTITITTPLISLQGAISEEIEKTTLIFSETNNTFWDKERRALAYPDAIIKASLQEEYPFDIEESQFLEALTYSLKRYRFSNFECDEIVLHSLKYLNNEDAKILKKFLYTWKRLNLPIEYEKLILISKTLLPYENDETNPASELIKVLIEFCLKAELKPTIPDKLHKYIPKNDAKKQDEQTLKANQHIRFSDHFMKYFRLIFMPQIMRSRNSSTEKKLYPLFIFGDTQSPKKGIKKTYTLDRTPITENYDINTYSQAIISYYKQLAEAMDLLKSKFYTKLNNSQRINQKFLENSIEKIAVFSQNIKELTPFYKPIKQQLTNELQILHVLLYRIKITYIKFLLKTDPQKKRELKKVIEELKKEFSRFEKLENNPKKPQLLKDEILKLKKEIEDFKA